MYGTLIYFCRKFEVSALLFSHHLFIQEGIQIRFMINKNLREIEKFSRIIWIIICTILDIDRNIWF